MSVESSHKPKSKGIIEVKDRWVKARVTMDSGAAGHVMLGTMFPRNMLERRTSLKKFVAANGEQIRNLGEKREFRGASRSGVRVLSSVSCNAQSGPSQKRGRAGRKESAHSKLLRWNGDQTGREQRSVHDGPTCAQM